MDPWMTYRYNDIDRVEVLLQQDTVIRLHCKCQQTASYQTCKHGQSEQTTDVIEYEYNVSRRWKLTISIQHIGQLA
jgi:hypothetical protein